MATDPVCGMYVDPRTATLTLVRENRTYYFCAASCRESFARPEAQRARLARQLLVAWPLAVFVAILTYGTPFSGWPYVALVAAGVVQVSAGRPFYRGTWDAIRGLIGNMDLLIAVATTAAFAYSAAVVLLPGRLPPAVYFDASSLILALILTGNYLEQRTRSRSDAVIRALRELLPTDAIRVTVGREERVSLDLISVGETLRVRPHERIPADGRVVAGRSWTDEAILTGESGPIPKGPGDAVVGGARNGDGLLDLQVTAVGPDAFVGTVARLVSDAEASRMPLRRTADRIAAWFAPAVLGLAVVAAVGWGVFGRAPLGISVLVFVTVAITACPCAFGIATPAAIAVGAGRAAEAGVLFRGEETIDRLAHVDWLITDKTGTLTQGRPSVARVLARPGTSSDQVLAIATSVSRGSDHPLSLATVTYATSSPAAPLVVRELRVIPGAGVAADWGARPVFFGRLRGREGEPDRWASDALQEADRRGESVSFVELDGAPVGALTYSDRIAPGVREAAARLQAMGLTLELATGDRPGAARSAAEAAGIDLVRAGIDPEGKQKLVAQRRSEGHVVAFVGDGVNDAPALAAADVGIAIGAGTDVAREAGGVLLLRTDFSGVPAAVTVARATVRKVRQNLAWALGYNAVLLPIAAGALVPVLGFGVYSVLPLLGAVAMAFSSTSVVTNSLSLGRLSLGPTRGALTPGSTL
ncbi:MAG: heavy metal translocating P-type ATPase [Thermoplasmata archaeon]|nr:heavy metal translocating P-type ATPase [Thermoplasmata archaeon]